MKLKYSIRKLSELAGVSARTLRYYDEIGLLKPSEISEAGYRYYGERELALLQQILFYRERGFDLKQIRKILYQDDFDIIRALKEHLRELEEQKAHVESLIRTVEQTIRSMKGECEMSDKERFQAFKERVVKGNEERYGAEEDWERFQNRGEEIKIQLKEAVLAGETPESERGKRIVLLHKEWLGKTWKQYTKEAHAAIADMYICDERFRLYYDKEVEGCAAFLEAAVRSWVERI